MEIIYSEAEPCTVHGRNVFMHKCAHYITNGADIPYILHRIVFTIALSPYILNIIVFTIALTILWGNNKLAL